MIFAHEHVARRLYVNMGVRFARFTWRQQALRRLRALAALALFVGLGLLLTSCSALGDEDDGPAILDYSQEQADPAVVDADSMLAWEQGTDRLMQGFLGAMANHAQFTEEFSREIESGDLTPVLDTGWSARQSFVFLADEARSLPRPSPEAERTTAELVQSFELFVAAYDDYLAAIETGDFDLIEQGEQKFQQAQANLLAVAPEVDEALGREPVAPAPGALGAIQSLLRSSRRFKQLRFLTMSSSPSLRTELPSSFARRQSRCWMPLRKSSSKLTSCPRFCGPRSRLRSRTCGRVSVS